MNYSRKGRNKNKNNIWLWTSVAKAAFVIAAAVWFCGGGRFSVQDDPASAAEPATVELVEDDTASELYADASEESSDAGGFVNPTEGVLTSDFGMRNGRRHTGIDIGADSGTGIYAARGGTVTYAGQLGGYGNYVVLSHKDGMETAYAHCSSIAAEVGEEVAAGQLIAYVGSTGNSTGPHLHFEVKVNGEFCNPLEYVVY